MHKPLTTAERKALMSPVADKPKSLTRLQKMNWWAELIRHHPKPVRMLHELEYMTANQLAVIRLSNSIFDVAAKDPMLAAAGLKSDDALENIHFFELSRDELHFIACDCHGQLDNSQMAHRIETIAAYSTRRSPF